MAFEARIILMEQPAEYSLLDFLVILFLKEFVLEKVHGPEHKKLAIFWTRIKRTDGAVRGKRDGPAAHDRLSRLPHIQS